MSSTFKQMDGSYRRGQLDPDNKAHLYMDFTLGYLQDTFDSNNHPIAKESNRSVHLSRAAASVLHSQRIEFQDVHSN